MDSRNRLEPEQPPQMVPSPSMQPPSPIQSQPFQPSQLAQPLPSSMVTPLPLPPGMEPLITPEVAPVEKKSKKKFVIIGLIIVLLLVSGIGYGAYAYITNTPSYMLSVSLDSLSKQSAFAASFKLDGQSSGSPVTFSGDFAFHSDQSKKASEEDIGLGAGSGRVALNVRVFEDLLFFRLSNLGNLDTIAKNMGIDTTAYSASPQIKAFLQQLNNQWYSVDNTLLQQGLGQQPGFVIKQGDVQQLIAIYNRHRFIVPDTSYADAAIDNVNTAHFSITIDKVIYKAFLTELKNENLASAKVSDADIAASDTDIDTLKKDVSIDIWVARGTKLMKQAKVTSLNSSSPGSLTLTFATTLPVFEPLDKPTSAKPVSEIITKVQELFLGLAASSTTSTDTNSAPL